MNISTIAAVSFATGLPATHSAAPGKQEPDGQVFADMLTGQRQGLGDKPVGQGVAPESITDETVAHSGSPVETGLDSRQAHEEDADSMQGDPLLGLTGLTPPATPRTHGLSSEAGRQHARLEDNAHTKPAGQLAGLLVDRAPGHATSSISAPDTHNVRTITEFAAANAALPQAADNRASNRTVKQTDGMAFGSGQALPSPPSGALDNHPSQAPVAALHNVLSHTVNAPSSAMPHQTTIERRADTHRMPNARALSTEPGSQARATEPASRTAAPLATEAFSRIIVDNATMPPSTTPDTPQTNPAAAPTASVLTASGNGLPTLSGAVVTPFQHGEWAHDFSRQTVALLSTKPGEVRQAELRLDPPELGPIRISISLNENVAHAAFVSAHSSVRQAVENALPQLAQQLAQAGISLGQANVSDQGQAQQGQFEPPSQRSAGSSSPAQGASIDASPGQTPIASRMATTSLIDTFA